MNKKLRDIQDKCNGLHSGTRFYEKYNGINRVTTEYHEHPDTHELVVMRTWRVADGEDDTSGEFEVESVHEPIVCEIMRKICELEEKIKRL